MPRVLAAFDSRWGDARTNLSTYLQLQLQMDRRDNKADGVLNGPTTESWFDHWYRHLVTSGSASSAVTASCLEPPAYDPQQPPHLRPRVQVTLADGTRLAPDYTVVAVDAPAAEEITGALRAAGSWGHRGPIGRVRHFHPAGGRPAAAGGGTAVRQRVIPTPWIEMGLGALGPVPDAWRHPVLLRHRIPAASRTHVLLGHGVGAVVDQPTRPVGEETDPRTATDTSRCSRSTSAISTPPPITWWTSSEMVRPPVTAQPTKSRQRCGARSSRPHEQRRQRRRRATAVARVVRPRPRADHGRRSRSG